MSVFTNPAASAPGQAGQYVAAILELLGDRDPIRVLETTPGQLRQGISGLDVARLKKPETEGKWSIAEVLQHRKCRGV